MSVNETEEDNFLLRKETFVQEVASLILDQNMLNNNFFH